MADDATGPETVLDARVLTKAFGGRMAVDHVDVRVDAGSVHGLLGRNGAGKTTLLRMILGLLTPDAGSVRLFGREAPAGDVAAREAVAGFVEEPRFYPYLSAQRNLELLSRLDGRAAAVMAGQVLERVDLAGRRRDRVGTFSTGLKQRLGLAAALLRSPRLLVLDEPTIGLDPAAAAATRQLLKGLAADGTAVLVSSHNMAEVAEVCDQVLIIRNGGTVWRGSRLELQAAAPAPAFRVWTSDDGRAAELARTLPVQADTAPGAAGAPLLIRAAEADRRAFVLALGRAGVAVDRMEPDVPPLESLFMSLTGVADPDNGGAVSASVAETVA